MDTTNSLTFLDNQDQSTKGKRDPLKNGQWEARSESATTTYHQFRQLDFRQLGNSVTKN